MTDGTRKALELAGVLAGAVLVYMYVAHEKTASATNSYAANASTPALTGTSGYMTGGSSGTSGDMSTADRDAAAAAANTALIDPIVIGGPVAAPTPVTATSYPVPGSSPSSPIYGGVINTTLT